LVLEECARLVAEAGSFNGRREDVLRTYRDQIWPESRYSSAIVGVDQASIWIREWTRRSRLKMNSIEGVTENPRAKGDNKNGSRWVEL